MRTYCKICLQEQVQLKSDTRKCSQIALALQCNRIYLVNESVINNGTTQLHKQLIQRLNFIHTNCTKINHNKISISETNQTIRQINTNPNIKTREITSRFIRKVR